MCPVVAEVEQIDELLGKLKAGEMVSPFIYDIIVVEVRVRSADPRAIRELEFMEMGEIPARE